MGSTSVLVLHIIFYVSVLIHFGLSQIIGSNSVRLLQFNFHVFPPLIPSILNPARGLGVLYAPQQSLGRANAFWFNFHVYFH